MNPILMLLGVLLIGFGAFILVIGILKISQITSSAATENKSRKQDFQEWKANLTILRDNLVSKASKRILSNNLNISNIALENEFYNLFNEVQSINFKEKKLNVFDLKVIENKLNLLKENMEELNKKA